MKHNFSLDETNEYLAQLGHEMRSPLHSILGFTYMLSNNCQEPDTKDWLRNIRTASKHLLDLVNDIIDVNRLSTQLIEIADESIDIYALMLDITSTLQPQINTGQLTVSTTIEPQCTQHWRGDRRKLKQILINILSNAIKFTPPKGRIKIHVSEENNHLRIAVKDTGVGMDKETLAHLFQPYFHSKSRINQQGTGLGLTITRRLIELMLGEIIISSKLNKGSEFIIILPLKKDDQARVVVSETKPEQLTETIHVLLVDDAPLHHEVLIGMVKNLPIVIYSAFTVEQTLALCPKIKPKLVLLDYRLPDGDGINLARTLKHCNNHLEQASPIKIAMLTAHRGTELQEALADNTIDAILYKPLELTSLIQLVAQCQQNTSVSSSQTKEVIIKKVNLSTPDYLQSLLPEFYLSLAEGINECQQHLNSHHYKMLVDTAHRLKGQAMILHHHLFWQQFESLETFAEARNYAMAVGVINQILQTYHKERSVL